MFDAEMFIQVRKSLLTYLELAGPCDSNKISQMCFEKSVSFLWNSLLASSQFLIDRMFWDSLGELLLFKREQIWEISKSAYFSRYGFLAENSPWKSRISSLQLVDICWHWVSRWWYWLVLSGTGSEQGGTGCQHDKHSENKWLAWSKSSNYWMFEEGKSDYGQTDRHTDRISSCRLDPFCRRGRVKK